MPRRVSLPGASELFRNTGSPDPAGAEDLRERVGDAGQSTQVSDPGHAVEVHRHELRIADPPPVAPGGYAGPGGPEPATEVPQAGREPQPTRARSRTTAAERGSGRVRHEEKITVYVSSDELIALEEARLRLRAEHGVAVDRGRIVRQAISAAMADFVAHGADSELVRKLSTS